MYSCFYIPFLPSATVSALPCCPAHLAVCFNVFLNMLLAEKKFCSLPLLRAESWLHPFEGHCEQQAVRDEGAIYVVGHPLLNRRCTRLPGCIRLRNDLFCVGWGVKLYSLTHPAEQ